MIILYLIGFILVVITICYTGYLTDVFLYGKERTLKSYRDAFQNPTEDRPRDLDYLYYQYNVRGDSVSKSKNTQEKQYKDPYDVQSFDTAEEFYQECGDEFHGFEDAADYFNTYRQ